MLNYSMTCTEAFGSGSRTTTQQRKKVVRFEADGDSCHQA
jgi:hypothetical protein